MATMTAGLLLDELRTQVPEAVPVIEEHVATYGEVLLHVLFGDLTRFVIQAHHHGQTELERRCLLFLERALVEGDNEVRNVIEVSFVENVGPWDVEIQRWLTTWPPALQAAARR